MNKIEKMIEKSIEKILSENIEDEKGKTNTSYEQLIQNEFIDKYVIVRTYSAGVHFGILVAYDSATKDVILKDARRLHKWRGGFTLSAVADGKINLENSRISQAVDFIKITEIEIVPIHAHAITKLKEAQTHDI